MIIQYTVIVTNLKIGIRIDNLRIQVINCMSHLLKFNKFFDTFKREQVAKNNKGVSKKSSRRKQIVGAQASRLLFTN